MPDALTASTSTGRQGALTKDYLARLASRDEMAMGFFRVRLYEAQVALEGDLDAILARIAAAREAGEPISPSWLYRERRYRTLMRRVLDETAAVSDAAGKEVIQAKKASLALGRSFAQASMQTAGVDALLGDLDPDVMRAIIAGTDYGTPLDDLFRQVTGDTVTAARAALVTGVTTGKGIPWIRRRFMQAMDVPRWRAETIARTESMRAFRAATQASFQENAEHLEGWVWTAALDSRTCPACVIMHGTVHAVTETLDGHPNCRCAMVPRTPDWDDILGPGHGLPDTRPTIQTGKEWLEDQDDDVQRAVLGPGKWQAWKDGKVSLDDLVTQHDSPTWGTHRREATLAEALAGKTQTPITRRSPEPVAPEPAPTPDRRPGRRWDDPDAPLDSLPYWTTKTAPTEEERRAMVAEAEAAGLYDFSWSKARKYQPAQLRDYVNLLMSVDMPTVVAQATLRPDRTLRVISQRVYQHRAERLGYWEDWDAPTGVPESMEEAVVAVNPNWTRPNAMAEGWQTNCTRCTYSYEARRRGVKAKAQPLPPGETWDDYRRSTEAAWNVDLEGLHKSSSMSWRETEDAMLKEGEGARGAVSAAWKSDGGGHIWNWEVVDGKVIWVDAQSGRVLTANEKMDREWASKDSRWVRLDDRPLNQSVRVMLDLE